MLAGLELNETLFLAVIFVSVFVLFMLLMASFRRQQEMDRTRSTVRGNRATDDDIDAMLGDDNQQLRYYLDVVRNAPPDSLKMRLVQAGFFSRSAIWKFNLIRFFASFGIFVLAQIALPLLVTDSTRFAALILGAVLAGIIFIACSYVLEQMGKKRMREYRKMFPDLMDLLLVCVDAGLSIDAALDRVTREFLQTVPDFGIQLAIINLEVRAGRSLHEALHNFSSRISLEEARMLAVLFRQSQELGSSVSRTLRTFAAEMRTLRIIRAEEKANLLPLKMLFPMALFMFPVSLIIVLVPVVMTLLDMLLGLTPG